MNYTQTKNITQIEEWADIDIENILDELPEIYDMPSSKLFFGFSAPAICYRKDGKLHREDGPAVIYSNGAQEWYQNGKLHRQDGPAVIYCNGMQAWYKNGKRHREDGPSLVGTDGSYVWYKNGQYHREDGPAIIKADGTEEYWLNGEQVDVLHEN